MSRFLMMGMMGFAGLVASHIDEGEPGLWADYRQAVTTHLVGRRYADQLREVEALQDQLLTEDNLDPTDMAEPPAAGVTVYDCDYFNILALGSCRFARQMTDSGTIYTVFAGQDVIYGKVDPAAAVIGPLPQGDLPATVRQKLDAFLPTLEICREHSTAGTTPSPYGLSIPLRQRLHTSVADCDPGV
jgi:hypothetical protein